MKRLNEILCANTSQAELVLFGLMFIFGAWILTPTWDTFSASTSYFVMAHFPLVSADDNEVFWGAVVMLVSLVGIATQAVDSFALRITARALASFVWLVISASFMYSNYRAAEAAIFSYIAIIFILLLWRGR